MTDEARQISISKNIRILLLIVFSAISGIIIWGVTWDYLKMFINLSPNAILRLLYPEGTETYSVDIEKCEALMKIMRSNFRYLILHLTLIIGNIIILPLVIGFYIGRNSDNNKYFNVSATIFLIFLFIFIKDSLLLSDFNIIRFIAPIVLFFPHFFCLTTLGAMVGCRYARCHSDNALYLTVYRDILSMRKRGIIYLCFALIVFSLNLKPTKNSIETHLFPYLRYFYAPVTFNNNPKDIPLLSVGNASKEPDSRNWSQEVPLNKREILSVAVYYNNNSYLYKAVNTRLALRRNKEQYIATLWADNASPIQHSVKLIYDCDNPVFDYINSRWYPNQKLEKQQLPFAQTGMEILNPYGINIGDVEGMWVGQGFFGVRFQYDCLDFK